MGRVEVCRYLTAKSGASTLTITPAKAGVWRIDVATLDPGWHIPLEVIVEARMKKK